MKCSDPECGKQATRELLGVQMCEAYYIEALEHSAHLLTEHHMEEEIEYQRKRLETRNKTSEALHRYWDNMRKAQAAKS